MEARREARKGMFVEAHGGRRSPELSRGEAFGSFSRLHHVCLRGTGHGDNQWDVRTIII